MAAATFNGITLRATLAAPVAGLTAVDLIDDLYSEWKEFMLLDPQNQGFPPAFLGVGGQPTSDSEILTASMFFNNAAGWRIETTDANQEVTVTGNLYANDITLPLFAETAGRTVAFFIDRSVNARNLLDAENLLMRKLMTNRIHTDPSSGKQIIYDDDDSTILVQGDMWKDVAGSIAYDGIVGGAERRDKLV